MKRRLIVLVTFFAGLYYFLEFVLPPTLPWQTVDGRFSSVQGATISLRVQRQPASVEIGSNTLIFRVKSSGTTEQVTPDQLAPGDRVRIGPTTYLAQWLGNVNNFFIILGAMAWGMGLLSLGMVHGGNIRKLRPEWYGSVIFFGAVLFGIVAGMGYGEQVGWRKDVSDLVVNRMLNPMGSTVFSLLAFHMASAAYRAFKVKSTEGALMMTSALVVMLGQIPLGLWLTHSFPDAMQLPAISQWLLYIANSAAVRGMYFGMMVGAIAVGLRFWLSLERGAFFDKEL